MSTLIFLRVFAASRSVRGFVGGGILGVWLAAAGLYFCGRWRTADATTGEMELGEQGKVRMNDPVAKYLPEFAQNGKDDITVGELLTHYSGLEPDLDLKMPWEKKETAYAMAFAETPAQTPGSSFVYSDINFIVLGALIERVSGETLDTYTSRHIFAPLKMTRTRYVPPAAWRPKISPPQYPGNEHMLRGAVHHPTARRMVGAPG